MQTPMPVPIDFYFDFISPYGYFAAEQVTAWGQRLGRAVRWHAFHMRGVMKEHLGVTQALGDLPLKGDYVRRDVRRLAAWHGLPYAPAPTAGFSSVNAGRVFCLLAARDPQAATRYALAVFRSHHAQGVSPNSWAACVDLAADTGCPVDGLDEATQGATARDAYRQATQRAVDQGVWGTPSFVLDGELFWGSDRMAWIEQWGQPQGAGKPLLEGQRRHVH